MIIALTASDNGSIASQEVEMETVYNFFVCKDNVNSCSDKINYGCFMHE